MKIPKGGSEKKNDCSASAGRTQASQGGDVGSQHLRLIGRATCKLISNNHSLNTERLLLNRSYLKSWHSKGMMMRKGLWLPKIIFLNEWRWKYWNHVKWHIKTHLQTFHWKKQNVKEVKGHWSCKLDICRWTLIPRNFTKKPRSYQMPTAPSLSLSWTILKTFAHFLKPSFIHFVWDAICLSVTLQLTTVRVFFCSLRKNRCFLQWETIEKVELHRDWSWNLLMKQQSKWNGTIKFWCYQKSQNTVIPLNLTFQLWQLYTFFSLNTKQPKSTRTKVNWMLLVHSLVI